MNLLVTDPASSPKSSGGKVLFGMLYGLAVFMYDVLRTMERPALGDDRFPHRMARQTFVLRFESPARPLDRIGRLFDLQRMG